MPNIAEILFDTINSIPEREALRIPIKWDNEKVIEYESINFKDLGEKIKQYQAGLIKKGFMPEDRILVMFPPSIDLYCFVSALLSLGMVAVFIDTGMGIKKVLMAIKDSQSKAIVSYSPLLKYRFFLPQLWPLKIYSTDKTGIGMNSFSDLKAISQKNIPFYPCKKEQQGLITFTTGSTGRPKGADRNHDSLIAQHLSMSKHLPHDPFDVDMTSFPVFVLHNLASSMTSILPAINFGFPAGVNPALVVSQMIEFNVNRLGGAPAFMSKITDYILEKNIRLPHLKVIITGGATVPLDLCEKMKAAFPTTKVNIVYGSTESEPISSVFVDEILSSKGQGFLVGPPCSSAELAIVNLPENPDDIKDTSLNSYKVPTGEMGEIVVKGEHVLKRYVDNPKATKENKIPAPEGLVWHRTSDVGYLDDKGRIWLTGRKSELIKYKSTTLHPYIIEKEMDKISGVKRSAIIQMDNSSEPVVALSIESNANKNDIEKTLIDCFNEHGLNGIKYIIIPEIPVDARHNSKIDRPKLKQILSKKKENSDKKDKFIVKLNPVDVLTLSGVLFSALSVGFSLSERFGFALSLIYLAMLADAFDGIFARKYGLERDFGRYLDGFVDTFDYLVAPSIFLYMWGLNSWYHCLILILFIMSGIIRLSVFNQIGNIKDETNGLAYLGMPVFWSVLFLGGAYFASTIINKEFILPIITVLFAIHTVFMIYNAPFMKFKNPKTILIVVLSGSIFFAICGFFEFINIKELSITKHIFTAIAFTIPCIFGGVLHMLAVKKDWLPSLKIPVYKPLFGANKTLRGFILMPIFSVLGAIFIKIIFELGNWVGTIDFNDISFIYFGLILGFVYVLAELPNSYIKRRMGIPPGGASEKHKYFFVFLDKSDSAIGVILLGIFFYHVPIMTAVTMFIMGPVISLLVTSTLYKLRLKENL
ncbi:MAG: CDP-archaeol synthase [Desulfobacterales bacterium]|nr:CDP-archaeol synthase [Desulfobacterales bacterium]